MIVKLDPLGSDDRREIAITNKEIERPVVAAVCLGVWAGCSALLCSSEIQIRCTSSKEQGSALLLLFYVRFVLATELLSRNKVADSSNSYPTFHVLSPNELVGSLFSLLFSSDNKTCVYLCWIWLVRLAEKLWLKVADLL